jgi:hypothetical protein
LFRTNYESTSLDNWQPSKKKSIERIDGIVALIMGIERATMQPAPFYSVYDLHGRNFTEIG